MELEQQSAQMRVQERERGSEKETVSRELARLEERKASVQKEYDEIIVLHRGEVAERGTFDRLMDEHGLFYSLFTVSQ